MALINRIAQDENYVAITAHAFSAAMYLLSIGEITRQGVINYFSMDAEDEVQLDQLISYYQSLSPEDQKVFHSRLEACNVALQVGAVDKAKYMSMLGMS